MYKTSGHGRAFLARAWCFLGGRRRDICQDNIECVFDGLGMPKLKCSLWGGGGESGTGDETGAGPSTSRVRSMLSWTGHWRTRGDSPSQQVQRG